MALLVTSAAIIALRHYIDMRANLFTLVSVPALTWLLAIAFQDKRKLWLALAVMVLWSNLHGGFVFGLADYAAMLAVNDPNVVLGAAETRFTHPVREGDVVIAVAEVVEVDRRKHTVHVSCSVDETVVMEGSFMTFVLKDHVLNGRV